jgi:hypothetical protein
MISIVKEIQLMHSVIVYLLTFVFYFPDMFRQIAMPSSGGIITNWIRCALNWIYKMVKQFKMLKTPVKFLCLQLTAQEFYRSFYKSHLMHTLCNL